MPRNLEPQLQLQREVANEQLGGNTAGFTPLAGLAPSCDRVPKRAAELAHATQQPPPQAAAAAATTTTKSAAAHTCAKSEAGAPRADNSNNSHYFVNSDHIFGHRRRPSHELGSCSQPVPSQQWWARRRSLRGASTNAIDWRLRPPPPPTAGLVSINERHSPVECWPRSDSSLVVGSSGGGGASCNFIPNQPSTKTATATTSSVGSGWATRGALRRPSSCSETLALSSPAAARDQRQHSARPVAATAGRSLAASEQQPCYNERLLFVSGASSLSSAAAVEAETKAQAEERRLHGEARAPAGLRRSSSSQLQQASAPAAALNRRTLWQRRLAGGSSLDGALLAAIETRRLRHRPEQSPRRARLQRGRLEKQGARRIGKSARRGLSNSSGSASVSNGNNKQVKTCKPEDDGRHQLRQQQKSQQRQQQQQRRSNYQCENPLVRAKQQQRALEQTNEFGHDKALPRGLSLPATPARVKGGLTGGDIERADNNKANVGDNDSSLLDCFPHTRTLRVTRLATRTTTTTTTTTTATRQQVGRHTQQLARRGRRGRQHRVNASVNINKGEFVAAAAAVVLGAGDLPASGATTARQRQQRQQQQRRQRIVVANLELGAAPRHLHRPRHCGASSDAAAAAAADSHQSCQATPTAAPRASASFDSAAPAEGHQSGPARATESRVWSSAGPAAAAAAATATAAARHFQPSNPATEIGNSPAFAPWLNVSLRSSSPSSASPPSTSSSPTAAPASATVTATTAATTEATAPRRAPSNATSLPASAKIFGVEKATADIGVPSKRMAPPQAAALALRLHNEDQQQQQQQQQERSPGIVTVRLPFELAHSTTGASKQKQPQRQQQQQQHGQRQRASRQSDCARMTRNAESAAGDTATDSPQMQQPHQSSQPQSPNTLAVAGSQLQQNDIITTNDRDNSPTTTISSSSQRQRHRADSQRAAAATTTMRDDDKREQVAKVNHQATTMASTTMRISARGSNSPRPATQIRGPPAKPFRAPLLETPPSPLASIGLALPAASRSKRTVQPPASAAENQRSYPSSPLTKTTFRATEQMPTARKSSIKQANNKRNASSGGARGKQAQQARTAASILEQQEWEQQAPSTNIHSLEVINDEARMAISIYDPLPGQQQQQQQQQRHNQIRQNHFAPYAEQTSTAIVVRPSELSIIEEVRSDGAGPPFDRPRPRRPRCRARRSSSQRLLKSPTIPEEEDDGSQDCNQPPDSQGLSRLSGGKHGTQVNEQLTSESFMVATIADESGGHARSLVIHSDRNMDDLTKDVLKKLVEIELDRRRDKLACCRPALSTDSDGEASPCESIEDDKRMPELELEAEKLARLFKSHLDGARSPLTTANTDTCLSDSNPARYHNHHHHHKVASQMEPVAHEAVELNRCVVSPEMSSAQKCVCNDGTTSNGDTQPTEHNVNDCDPERDIFDFRCACCCLHLVNQRRREDGERWCYCGCT